MSSFCPLCGKNKSDDALFCEPCSKKIRSDYEVEMSEALPEIRVCETIEIAETAENTDVPKETEVPQKMAFAEEAEVVEVEKIQNVTQVEVTGDVETHTNENKNEYDSRPTSISEHPLLKNRSKLLIGIGLAVLLVIGGFLLFNNNSPQQPSRFEQTDWQRATQANTIAAFETFIETHPFGQHTKQAIENIRMLRQKETAVWEAIRETNNVAVLQEFINQHPTNPHVVQAKARIELLTWERSNR